MALPEREGKLKVFQVTLYDANRFKHLINVEANNAASLELSLNGTLGMGGCEIISVEEYKEMVY